MNTKTFTNNLDNGIKFVNSPTDYLILMKPRVMSLVVFTAFVGYYVGLSDNIDHLNPILAIIGIFAIAIGAGAVSILLIQLPSRERQNQRYHDADALGHAISAGV